MNPANSDNQSNKDCERLHHDKYLGAMQIGWGNLRKLQKKRVFNNWNKRPKIFKRFIFD